MARILITGSSDGLGSLVAQRLVKKGHKVVLHGRNQQRAQDASSACPGAETVLVADLSSFSETKKFAEEANKLGSFDVVVHNAGLYRSSFQKTADGIPALTSINTFAPFILTALLTRPKRLVYISSGYQQNGDATLADASWKKRGEKGWNETAAYAESKLHNVLLAKAVARHWPEVKSNSIDPGWVPTKMGGSSASGNIEDAVNTYLHLIEGGTDATGKHFFNSKERTPKREADDPLVQDKLLEICAEVTGVTFPK